LGVGATGGGFSAVSALELPKVKRLLNRPLMGLSSGISDLLIGLFFQLIGYSPKNWKNNNPKVQGLNFHSSLGEEYPETVVLALMYQSILPTFMRIS
jgi:hypothetical protein